MYLSECCYTSGDGHPADVQVEVAKIGWMSIAIRFRTQICVHRVDAYMALTHKLKKVRLWVPGKNHRSLESCTNLLPRELATDNNQSINAKDVAPHFEIVHYISSVSTILVVLVLERSYQMRSPMLVTLSHWEDKAYHGLPIRPSSQEPYSSMSLHVSSPRAHTNARRHRAKLPSAFSYLNFLICLCVTPCYNRKYPIDLFRIR